MNRVAFPSLFGAPVRISWTWMVVAAALSAITFYLFIPDTGTDRVTWIASAILVAAGIVLSLIAHEYGHVVSARRAGSVLDALDPSLLGGLPDTCYAPQSPANELRVASGGPLVSLLLTVSCGAAWMGLGRPDGMPGIGVLLVGAFNLIVLAVNLLPGSPFDGGRVLRAFIWYLTGDLVVATRAAAIYGQFLLVSGLITGVMLLSVGEDYALWGAWILLMCWPLNQARVEGLAQTVWKEAGRLLRIDDLFQAGVNRVQASATIDDSIESLLDNYRRGPTLVMDGLHIVGIVDLSAFRKIPRASWTQFTVGDVMSSIDALPRIESDASVIRLLEELPTGSTKIILVQRDGKIVAAADREFVLERVQAYVHTERLNRPRRR